jgi:putative membrane protein
MVMKISDEDKNKIEKCIEQIEKKTSGEVVPMIIQQSDAYPAANWRLACLFMIQAAIIYYFSSYSFDDESSLIILQVVAMAVGYLLANIPFLKRLLSTGEELAEEVSQRAMQAFLENNLHTTKNRNGILIMVTLLERKVEILADKGINDLVPKETWQAAVPKLASQIGKGNLVEGMIECLNYCGDELAKHFPIEENDTNELDNILVID